MEFTDGFCVAGFDPPSSRNLGWAVLRVEGGVARRVAAGVHPLPDGDGPRLLSIQEFVIGLFDEWDIRAMCFERAIGKGQEDVRERIGENTGVIKLIGASYGAELKGLHPSTTAKTWTGSGISKKGNVLKTRVKRFSKELFYPGMKYGQITVDEKGSENFEHMGDALALAGSYLLQRGVPVEGVGMSLLPLKVVDEDEG